MSDRWVLGLLLVLLLGHLFLLSTHERAQGNRLEKMMLATLGPVGHGAVALSDGVSDVLASFRLAGTLRRQNEELRRELEGLRHEVARLQGVEEALERLSRTAGYTRPDTGEVVVADVVWVDQASSLRTLVLYTGTVLPRRNQPVVTENGLVGRVVVPAGRYAKVLLLSDPSHKVSAMIARTRQRGILRGGGDGPLVLEHVPLQADVRVGDEVVTAGIDGVFPRGLRIGTVEEVRDGGGISKDVAVEPMVDLATLDQVYVLTRETVPQSVVEALPGAAPPTSDDAASDDADR